MGRQKSIYSPLTIARTAKHFMEKGLIHQEPVWYQPVLNTPPMTDFSRKPARTNQPRPWNRATDIREMQQMNIGMDTSIRTKFYKEHPWELARPKVVVEEDGADYVRQDWSRMEQVGKPLDGESVVQRTLYLMNETKPPTERYREIHGFDESQARGRPQPRLPQFGNIQEVNKDVDNILRTWREITTELDGFLQHRKALKEEVAKITEESISLTDEQKSNLTTLRDQIKYISVLIHRLQKRVRKMSRLTPQVAYLQACSEFYMLRQQQEVEVRIAIEQARAFRLEMGQSVNEQEISREQAVLLEWKLDAQKRVDMMYSGKKDRNTPKVEAATPQAALGPGSIREEPMEEEEDTTDSIKGDETS